MIDKDMTLQLEYSEAAQAALNQIADHNRLRDEHVWLQMWSSVANAWNCKSSEAAARWADEGLKQYRERFPKERA